MKKLNSIILYKTDTIKKAIQTLELSGQKIVLICDKSKKLISTVTDGDIRRAILNKEKLSTPLSKIMAKKPFFVNSAKTDDYILNKMISLKINHVPIIDKDMKLIDLKNIETFSAKKVLENPVVLMAGGFGKRLMPLTKTTPKPLLKINNTPILEIIIKKISSQGFENFIISTHYRAEKIVKYFGDGKKFNLKIDYLKEQQPLGTAGCLSLLNLNHKTLPIIIMNGDIITDINFHNLLEFHNRKRADITVCVREKSYQNMFGVVESKKEKLISINEKPLTSFFINAGIYIINPNILKFVKKKYLDMPDLINQMKQRKKNINIYPIIEQWNDIGDMKSLVSEYEKFK